MEFQDKKKTRWIFNSTFSFQEATIDIKIIYFLYFSTVFTDDKVSIEFENRIKKTELINVENLSSS